MISTCKFILKRDQKWRWFFFFLWIKSGRIF